MTLVYLAIASGLLQALGYIFYLRGILHHKITPNPTSWLMWAYGTVVLTLLEADRFATWELLVLPIVCSISSVFVAGICWRRGTIKWPEHATDRLAFITDILLTIGYATAWVLLARGVLNEIQKDTAVLVFLFLSNATIATSFLPLLREVRVNPNHEKALPWFTWMCAYGSLAVLTVLQSGWSSELMIFPTLNFVAHAIVAWHVRPNCCVHL